jgi:hypothetical protein
MNDDLQRKKLEVLKEEVNIAFAGVVPLLENGRRLIIVAEDLIADIFDPEAMATVGQLVKVCGTYGATVIFSKKDSFAVFNRHARIDSRQHDVPV